MRQLLTGPLLAPLWALIACAVYASMLPIPAFLKDLDRGVWIGLGALAGAIFGHPGTLMVGLPVHRLCVRRGYRSALTYLTTWSVIGLVIWLVAFVAAFAPEGGLRFAVWYVGDTIV